MTEALKNKVRDSIVKGVNLFRKECLDTMFDDPDITADEMVEAIPDVLYSGASEIMETYSEADIKTLMDSCWPLALAGMLPVITKAKQQGIDLGTFVADWVLPYFEDEIDELGNKLAEVALKEMGSAE